MDSRYSRWIVNDERMEHSLSFDFIVIFHPSFFFCCFHIIIYYYWIVEYFDDNGPMDHKNTDFLFV